MLALVDGLEEAATGLRLVSASAEELARVSINRSAGIKVTPGDSRPDHPTWDWLPDSARNSGTGLVFIYDHQARITVPVMAIAPPFPIATSLVATSLSGLRDNIETSAQVLAVDLHAGKARIGIVQDEQIVRSRTVSRYVRGQHRAGGQSANRFKRNRQGWQHKFSLKLAEAVIELARDSNPRTEWLAVAGDRITRQQWLTQTEVAPRSGLRLLPRNFDSRSNDRSALSRLAREVWSSRVFEPPTES